MENSPVHIFALGLKQENSWRLYKMPLWGVGERVVPESEPDVTHCFLVMYFMIRISNADKLT